MILKHWHFDNTFYEKSNSKFAEYTRLFKKKLYFTHMIADINIKGITVMSSSFNLSLNPWQIFFK